MESNDDGMQQQVTCDSTDTKPTSYEVGVNELSRLEDGSDLSLSRDRDATCSNEPQPFGLLTETPQKRRRAANAPTELRYNPFSFSFSFSLYWTDKWRRSKRAKNPGDDEYRIHSSSPPLGTHSRRTTTERPSPRAANTRTRGPNWSPEFLLTEPKSRLVHCNLNVSNISSPYRTY